MAQPVAKFGKLSVHGFRRLNDVRLSLRPLSVLIGANGTGKTSVLDVLSLLASSAQGKLSSAISDLSGLANLLTWGKAQELGFEITMEVPGYEPLDYYLWLRPQGVAHVIREEILSQRRMPDRPPFRHIDSYETDVKYFDPEKKTLLDEPEVSLHPELLSLLAEQLREASQRTQIIVATHSDTLIRFLQPAEVVVLDSTEDGLTTLTRADELDLDDWLKDYALDELWRNGRLGART